MYNSKLPLANIFLKTYYQNVYGFKTKFNILRHIFPIHGIYNVIILPETRLTPNIHDFELGFARFQIFIYDRNIRSSSCYRAVSVLITTKSNLNVSFM